MATITLTLRRPHPVQRQIIDECRRFNVISCGRRFGKSILSMNRLIRPALGGQPTAYFAPTYRMLSEIWREVRHTLYSVTAKANAQERRLELITGGVIDFWSLENPDSVRGRKYKQVEIDEAAMVGGLEDAWFNVIRPTLTDLKGGADFFSTPRGHNFFWKAWTWGQADEHPEWMSWQFPTTANPYIDPTEVEAARLQLPERIYQQEYLAVFLEDAGGVFRRVRDAIDAGRTANSPPRPGHAYAIGCDLARVEDFTVLTVLDGHGHQVYHERFNQISWERQIAAIKAVADRYPGTVTLDTTGLGDPIYEQLRKQGVRVIPFTFTGPSKEKLIDHLAVGLEQSRYRLMDVPAQTNELQAFQYELTPSRNVRMAAPEGCHDDCVIALALAAWGARKGLEVPEMPEERAAREAAAREARRKTEAEWHRVDNPAFWE